MYIPHTCYMHLYLLKCFLMFLHQNKNCHITFSSLMIHFHNCSLLSFFLICPHTPFFHQFDCYPFVLFAGTKGGYNVSPWLILSVHIFWSLFFAIILGKFSNVQMIKKRLHHVFSQMSTVVFSPFVLYIFVEKRCQK